MTDAHYYVTITYREPHRGDLIIPAADNVFVSDGVLTIVRPGSELGIPLDLIDHYRSEERTT